jgi:hypothetical protein
MIWNVFLGSWLVLSSLWLSAYSGLLLSTRGIPISIRLGVFFLFPACLAIGGAAEIYWGWTLLGTITAIGNWNLERWRGRRMANDQPHATSVFRFSTLTLLTLTAVSAWLVFVARKTETLDLTSWRMVLSIAFVFGLMSVWTLATVHATRRLSLALRRFAFCLSFLYVALVLPLLFWDQFLMALVDLSAGWPPFPAVSFASLAVNNWWIAIGVAYVLLSLLVPVPSSFLVSTRTQRCWTIVVILMMTMLPAWVGYYLLFAPQLTVQEDHEPNAYREWIEICTAARVSSMTQLQSTYSEWTKVPVAKQSTALMQTMPTINALKTVLEKPIRIPLPAGTKAYFVSPITDILAASKVALAYGESTVYYSPDESLSDFLLVAKMDSLHQKGRNLDSLLGCALGRRFTERIKRHIKRFSPQSRESVIQELMRVLSPMDDVQTIAKRDFLWCNKIWWISRVHYALTSDASMTRSEQHSFAINCNRADYQMLIIELLLHNYRDEHGFFPMSLEEAIAESRTYLLTDPFAKDGSHFRYISENGGYLLYSVGENGIDDGGDVQLENDSDFSAKDFSLERHSFPYPANELWDSDEAGESSSP